MIKIADLINQWFKDGKYKHHYEVHDDMIECKYYHSGGVNRIRINYDSIYYWRLGRDGFNKIILSVADPDFFEKLDSILYNQCAGRRTKIFRQL